MSRLHVLARSGTCYQCVLHEPVPKGQNDAGVNWSAAVLGSGMGGTSMLRTPAITPEELAQIEAGEIIERPFQWDDSPVPFDVETQQPAALADIIAGKEVVNRGEKDSKGVDAPKLDLAEHLASKEHKGWRMNGLEGQVSNISAQVQAEIKDRLALFGLTLDV